MTKTVYSAARTANGHERPWRSERFNDFAKATRVAFLVALVSGFGLVQPALATIDNDATASGTFGGNPVNSNTASESVTVAPAGPEFTVTKAAGAPTVANGADPLVVDAGDTITYSYTIQNTGNVTMTNVTPVDPGPTFNGNAAVGSLGAFTLTSGSTTLAPGATATFDAVFTLAQMDVYNAAGIANGVANTATASGDDPGGNPYTEGTNTGSATTTIPANQALQLAKSFVITTDNGTPGQADVGDVITYTYTVTNTGNVAVDDVTISDTHEPGEPHQIVVVSTVSMQNETDPGSPDPLGVTADGGANGSWDVLGPESFITFTYAHTVTQAEFNAQ